MLPLVRLHRLSSRAATIATSQLEHLLVLNNNNNTATTATTSSQTENNTSSKIEKDNDSQQQTLLQNNSPSSLLSFSSLQQATSIATYSSSLISILYNLNITDRTLWMQLKSLSLQVSPYSSSSLEIVSMLECCARKAVLGPLECKKFQQLLGNDVAALHVEDILRLVASCNLAGAPLQNPLQRVVAENCLRWAANTANCSVWWILADTADQLPNETRRLLVHSLAQNIEQVRVKYFSSSSQSQNQQNFTRNINSIWPSHEIDTAFILWRLRAKGQLALSSHHSSQSSSSSNTSGNSKSSFQTNAETTASTGVGTVVEKEFNPVYSDELLRTIRIDRLSSPKCAIFLLRGLSLSSSSSSSSNEYSSSSNQKQQQFQGNINSNNEEQQGLSLVTKSLLEDLCRMIHNNILGNRISNSSVLRAIIESLSNETLCGKVPSAAIAGVEASHEYLRHHSYEISRETTKSILRILVAFKDANLFLLKNKNINSNKNKNINVEKVEETEVSEQEQEEEQQFRRNNAQHAFEGSVKRLKESIRRLILISTSSEIHELLTLSDRIGFLDLANAEFALDLMQTQKAPQHEIKRIAMLVKAIASRQNINSNSSYHSKINKITGASVDLKSISLVSSWSVIRALPSPKIAFFASTAAKIIFANPTTNLTMTPFSNCVITSAAIVNLGISQQAMNQQQQQQSNITSSGNMKNQTKFSLSASGWGANSNKNNSSNNNSSGNSSFPSPPNTTGRGTFGATTSSTSSSSSSSSPIDSGLVSLASAVAEVGSSHRGLRALSAKDCASLIASTSVLPNEARVLVLRNDPRVSSSALALKQQQQSNSSSFSSSSSNNNSWLKTRIQTLESLTSSTEKTKSFENQKNKNSENVDDNSFLFLQRHPLFLELKSTTRFLEAQSSINTSLEINNGADVAIFTSAQQRLSRFLQLSFPIPISLTFMDDDKTTTTTTNKKKQRNFLFDNNNFEKFPDFAFYCGRLVSAIASHRLATFRLPLWLLNIFSENYLKQQQQQNEKLSSSSSSQEEVYHAIRAIYSCAYFGIDRPETIERFLKYIVSVSVSDGDGDGKEEMKFKTIASSSSSFSTTTRQNKYTKNDNSNNSEQEEQQHFETNDENSNNIIVISPRGLFFLLKHLPHCPPRQFFFENFNKLASEQTLKWISEFSSSSQSQQQQQNSKTSTNSFTQRDRRRLLDILCCAAALDISPQHYKSLIEHLHPFDSTIFPVADSMFFFGHVAQKKRLSGISLRTWRTLAMHLDKIAVTSANSETLISSCCNSFVQTSTIIPPTLLTAAHFIGNGGASSSCDSLFEKLRLFGPFEPLVLAQTMRIAMKNQNTKVRPPLSQLVCRAFDSTAAESFSAVDLCMVLEIFSGNLAQRVAVGLIQADACLNIAFEALQPKLLDEEILSEELFFKIAMIPCSSGDVVATMVERMILMNKTTGTIKRDDETNETEKEKLENEQQQKEEEEGKTKRRTLVMEEENKSIWMPLIFNTVVKHCAYLEKCEEDLWNEAKVVLIEPLEQICGNAEKETLSEILTF